MLYHPRQELHRHIGPLCRQHSQQQSTGRYDDEAVRSRPLWVRQACNHFILKFSPEKSRIPTCCHGNTATTQRTGRVDGHSMATLISIDAVRRKIQTLQQVAYEAEDRAELLLREADMESQAREAVTLYWQLPVKSATSTGSHALSCDLDKNVFD